VLHFRNKYSDNRVSSAILERWDVTIKLRNSE